MADGSPREHRFIPVPLALAANDGICDVCGAGQNEVADNLAPTWCESRQVTDAFRRDVKARHEERRRKVWPGLPPMAPTNQSAQQHSQGGLRGSGGTFPTYLDDSEGPEPHSTHERFAFDSGYVSSHRVPYGSPERITLTDTAGTVTPLVQHETICWLAVFLSSGLQAWPASDRAKEIIVQKSGNVITEKVVVHEEFRTPGCITREEAVARIGMLAADRIKGCGHIIWRVWPEVKFHESTQRWRAYCRFSAW